MEDKKQTRQDRDKARRTRRIRNQVIVFIGVFVFVAAVAAAMVPGIKYLLRGGEKEEQQNIGQEAGQPEWMAELASWEAENPPEKVQQSAEKIETVLAKKRPALVSLNGTGDGSAYKRGSGFIIEIREDVLFICTCGHVIEDADSWEVGFYDGTTVQGVKTGISQVYDVGIVEVSLSQLSEQLAKSLFALEVDLDHWNSLYGQKTYAGFVSMYSEEGKDSYVTGPLLNVLADYPWGELRQSEFQLKFADGDSGAPIFDEEGMLISMVLGFSYDEGEDISRDWGVPLSALVTCYMEITNQKGGA